MRKLLLLITLLVGALASTAVAHDRHDERRDDRGHHHDRGHHRGHALPQTIALPAGFQPEGIASKGKRLYVGSLVDGAIWAGSAKRGSGAVLVPGHPGRSAAGIEVVGSRLLVSGGASGAIYVYDRRTGADVASHDVGGTFINDVTTLRGSAYFTDSQKPVIYALPKSGIGTPVTVPITGDLVHGAGFNANGIEAVRGRLVTVQSSTGKLFTVDPATGVSREIDLGGATLPAGDGLLAKGRTVLVVQNTLNRIAVVRLSRDLRSGRVVRTITDPDFDVPTTITFARHALWAVNARFSTPPTPTTPYDVVRVG